ncbi:unnamed protein product [Linum trigynum]|uniref:RING-type domain-containing protein n=1 Tax=Linum trigynum TaxID=586398 RepID=A0AAV2FFW7_9ROSI
MDSSSPNRGSYVADSNSRIRRCLICGDIISPMMRPCVTYSCSHVFHIDCAESITFHSPRRTIICPLCRCIDADTWRQLDTDAGTTWLLLDADGNCLPANPQDLNITAFILNARHVVEARKDGYHYKSWFDANGVQLCRIR